MCFFYSRFWWICLFSENQHDKGTSTMNEDVAWFSNVMIGASLFFQFSRNCRGGVVEINNFLAWRYCQNLGFLCDWRDGFCWAWKILRKNGGLGTKLLGKQVGNRICCWLLVLVGCGLLVVVGCWLLLILESCQFHWELIVQFLELPKRSEPTRTDFNNTIFTNPKDPWDWFVYLHLP